MQDRSGVSPIKIDVTLRAAVMRAVGDIRAMLDSGRLPPPVNDNRCRACSLIDICQPAAVAARDRQASARAALFDPDA